ncbi:MAG: 5-formyltetrahydrofolate cyclo-ligase [Clostridium sp.]|nr:5-formyltetrahydrofolate cyclo-ligase [Clostridium sp.]MCM1398845.1 5-formyltetrahydrofolate cyclo-ligase [Clostridium sp.]MCM1458524.1 5-formyltetrahydrofolate cyclo-ligase [Bacteroides sp.]
MDDKKKLRKRMLALRSGLAKAYVIEASHEICTLLQRCQTYRKADNICLYVPVNNEVNVTELFESVSAKIYLPKVQENIMEFYLYTGMEHLVNGAYNIPEPDSGVPLTPDDHTLVVMPGVAFSRDGYRLGYGGGYYDRYLQRYPQCNKIAVCYKEQMVDTIPFEAYDVKPDSIISNE